MLFQKRCHSEARRISNYFWYREGVDLGPARKYLEILRLRCAPLRMTFFEGNAVFETAADSKNKAIELIEMP
jgi:hypothetical protein